MLEEDEASAVVRASQIFQDERVRQFHDPDQRLGRLIGRDLGEPSKVAWDIYLFYEADMEWNTTNLPLPSAWAHQMKGWWMDHYHSGEELVHQLHALMGEVLSSSKSIR